MYAHPKITDMAHSFLGIFNIIKKNVIEKHEIGLSLKQNWHTVDPKGCLMKVCGLELHVFGENTLQILWERTGVMHFWYIILCNWI